MMGLTGQLEIDWKNLQKRPGITFMYGSCRVLSRSVFSYRGIPGTRERWEIQTILPLRSGFERVIHQFVRRAIEGAMEFRRGNIVCRRIETTIIKGARGKSLCVSIIATMPSRNEGKLNVLESSVGLVVTRRLKYMRHDSIR